MNLFFHSTKLVLSKNQYLVQKRPFLAPKSSLLFTALYSCTCIMYANEFSYMTLPHQLTHILTHPSTQPPIHPPIGGGVSANHKSSNRNELSWLGPDLFDLCLHTQTCNTKGWIIPLYLRLQGANCVHFSSIKAL